MYKSQFEHYVNYENSYIVDLFVCKQIHPSPL